MTIIVAKAPYIVADSFAFANGYGFPSFAKISRAPDGSLVGVAGLARDAWLMHEWVRDGMDFATPPTLLMQVKPDLDDDISVDWLWLKTDRTLWRGTADLNCTPIEGPAAIGVFGAGCYALGAMAAGMFIEDAVKLSTARFVHTGGPVQTERLADAHTAQARTQVPRIPVIGVGDPQKLADVEGITPWR